MQKFEVIGILPIVDAVTGEDVNKGGTVTLDPEQTNIRALMQARLIAAPKPAKKASK